MRAVCICLNFVHVSGKSYPQRYDAPWRWDHPHLRMGHITGMILNKQICYVIPMKCRTARRGWRQGRALTRSFPPMCVRVQQGQAPGILHRCSAVATSPVSRWAERATFEGLGRGSMGYVCMNEFHYSINIPFVPALSPACPRFVPGSLSPQTRMAAGFWQFVPVSPALLAVMVPKEVQSGPVRP